MNIHSTGKPNSLFSLLFSFLFLLLLWSVATTPAVAQAPADSIAAWTETMRSGSLVERMHAASRLYAIGPDDLPQSAVDAMVDELDRIHDAQLYDREIPGRDDLQGEAFGEYYMDLAVVARAAGGDAARRSIILSAPVSRGMARRAATFGDDAIPVLVEMLEQDFASAAALEVMALAWFWADSTGSALSSDSRRTIIESFAEVGVGEDRDLVYEVAYALLDSGDPSFIPLAQWIYDVVADQNREVFGLLVLPQRTIPALQERAGSLTTVELLDRHLRIIRTFCFDAVASLRLGMCEAAENQLSAARGLLAEGQITSAANAMEAVIDRLDRGLENGAITEAEHALLAGGLANVVERIR